MRNLAILLFAIVSISSPGCGCGGDQDPIYTSYFPGNPAPWCRSAWLIENNGGGYTISAVDLETGDKTNLPHDYAGGMNALGYNQIDQRMYGVDWNAGASDTLALLRLTMESDPIQVERIDLPIPVDLQGIVRRSSYVGDVSADGYLYLHAGSTQIRDGSGIARVNVNPHSPGYLSEIEYTPFNGPEIENPTHNVASYGDWAISPLDGMIYVLTFRGANDITHLWRIDPQTGATEDLGETSIPTTRRFGGTYMVGKYTYWLHNSTGEIWRMDLTNPTLAPATAEFVSVGESSSANDGAHCSGGN